MRTAFASSALDHSTDRSKDNTGDGVACTHLRRLQMMVSSQVSFSYVALTQDT